MSDDAIQRFDCVSGVDNLADRLRVNEEGGNIRPVCPPAATYLRVPCIPFLPECIQRLQRAFFRGCAVNLFQVTGYSFIVFPRHEPQAVAYHVYYAQLDLRLRVDGINRFREAFQAVHAGDKDIVQAAIFQFRRKRAARTVLTGMCYSVGSATRQGSSSPTRFIGQSAMTSRT